MNPEQPRHLDRYGRAIPDEEYQTKDFERSVALRARTEATRVRDDYGKLWFNIIDYTGSATRLFADPSFDGDPTLLTEEELEEGGKIHHYSRNGLSQMQNSTWFRLVHLVHL